MVTPEDLLRIFIDLNDLDEDTEEPLPVVELLFAWHFGAEDPPFPTKLAPKGRSLTALEAKKFFDSLLRPSCGSSRRSNAPTCWLRASTCGALTSLELRCEVQNVRNSSTAVRSRIGNVLSGRNAMARRRRSHRRRRRSSSTPRR